MDTPVDRLLGEIEALVSAASVPMLVADYNPLIARYGGLSVSEIADRLGDEAELTECLRLPVQLVANDEWAMLYGFPFEDQVPDLVTRHFSADGYPELRIAEQQLARLNIFEMDPKLGVRPTVQALDNPGPLKDILVKALDRNGKSIEVRLKGFPARVAQHETDHLDGVLFFDRMASLQTLTYLEEYSRYHSKEEED